ncbi:ATP-binding protein [Sphingobacterium sp. HJSM2_6]|uniref:ATP-binding protein n=1 Tax=Sphingobacterium sp. HJSM2_6 TaxID=3366264 RepID=UPI003BE6E5B4
MKTIKVQKFGQLIILDLNLNIVGITHNFSCFISKPVQPLLNHSFDELLNILFKKTYHKLKKTVVEFSTGQQPRALLTKKINNITYYIKISKVKSLIYLEWEPQYRKKISTSDLNEIGFLFEHNYSNNWNYVCKAINKIIQYDRVFVLQVQETGHSKVLAENISPSCISFAKKEYSRHFLPADSIPYFDSIPYRYLPCINEETQDLYNISTDIDINSTQLISPSKIHLKFLEYLGVQSAIFFPLFLQGKFWGLVVAHNYIEKMVDLQNRKICTFIVQNAMSKYETLVKQGLLDINQQVREFQTTLFQRLTQHKTIHCALIEYMDNLRLMLKSDGIAIYNEGDIYFKGLTPSSKLFYDIIHYLQKSNDKTILLDHNFKKNHKHFFEEELPFAGLIAYNVDKSKGYYILLFKRESITSETQLQLSENHPLGIFCWDKTIYDSAIPWDDQEINLLNSLQITLNDSLMQNSLESKRLTKSLAELNNELEMFTYTLSHDLKNPLSILKMGIEFLKNQHDDLEAAIKTRWFHTLASGIENIEDIIENIIKLSHSKMEKMQKNPIALAYLIRKIMEENLLIYQYNCEVEYDSLLPVWGEKIAVYQIFSNILGNSIKYTQNSQHPKILITSTVITNMVCYTISDNGIGIPASDLEHIFEMLSRAKNVQHYNGSGIGLALVKRIMERLGGKIEISSIENVGTTVKLYFPIVSEFPAVLLESTF